MKSVGVKIGIVAAVIALAVVAFVARSMRKSGGDEGAAARLSGTGTTTKKPRPRLVDLGSKTCIPCKLMAPMLEELKKEYAGRMVVEFIDVWENPGAGQEYGILVIPTQIFYAASGKELFRHEGFFSKKSILNKWRELGVELGVGPESSPPEIVRETPLVEDTRAKDAVCFMCDGDVDPKTKVRVRSPTGGVTNLCSPHCYFILESCLLDKSSMAEVTATDYATGAPVAFNEAVWLYGADESARPTIRALSSRDAALAEMRTSGGSIIALDALRQKEYAVRCGFCDRVMYPQDNGSVVKVVGGPETHGCCPHCALGVAARLKKDIIVEYHDPVSNDLIRIETFDGEVKSIAPPSAVAWFGQKKKPDGTWGSAGCFHQWNFATVDNLRKWLDAHPRETGRLITIHKALANKMKMSPGKIKKACKIGECK